MLLLVQKRLQVYNGQTVYIKFFEEDIIMSNYEIRKLAREKLGGSIFNNVWLMALVAYIVYSAIVGALSYVGIGIIFLGCLDYGYYNLHLDLVRGKSNIDLSDCFSGFKCFSKSLVLGLLQYIFIFLWSLLFVIPGFVKSYSYAMSYYIAKDHPEYTPSQCITESRRIMEGRKMDLFLLDLSFVGWMLVAMLTCGIGLLWVGPYMMTARAAFYYDLVGNTSSANPDSADTAECAE